jgi:hypothetical protein
MHFFFVLDILVAGGGGGGGGCICCCCVVVVVVVVGQLSAQNIEISSPLNSLSDFFCLTNSCFKPLFHFSCVLYSRWFVKLNDLRTWHQLEIDNNISTSLNSMKWVALKEWSRVSGDFCTFKYKVLHFVLYKCFVTGFN